MDTSCYENYDDAHDSKYEAPFEVPLLKATEESLAGFGNLVTSFDEEKVIITPWPVQGHRKLCPGTGIFGGVRKDENVSYWEGDICVNINKAVPDAKFKIGRLAKGETTDDRRHVLVRAVNYHPDGGQVFFPTEKKPFVALLGKPGDDVTLEDFRAFFFDGSCGVQIHPNVWHQAMYPIDGDILFKGKQSAIYGCVYCHFTEEFGRYISVPLNFKD